MATIRNDALNIWYDNTVNPKTTFCIAASQQVNNYLISNLYLSSYLALDVPMDFPSPWFHPEGGLGRPPSGPEGTQSWLWTPRWGSSLPSLYDSVTDVYSQVTTLGGTQLGHHSLAPPVGNSSLIRANCPPLQCSRLFASALLRLLAVICF